jgi:predicted  nucleic acid-binding Zn-ribbon protein
MAQTPEEQKQYQGEIKKLERLQRRQRQEIFDVEDEIEARRDQLIDVLERRMKQKIQVQRLFRIRWQLA